MAAGDLIDLAAFAMYRGAASGPKDQVLAEDCISAASMRFITDTGLAGISASFTDTFDGAGGAHHVLRTGPATAITSVTIDGETIPARTTTAGGWVLGRGNVLHLDGYTFVEGIQNCSVVYVAGWTAGQVPSDVRVAVAELAAYLYSEKDRVGVFSRGIPGADTVSYQVLTLPVAVQRVIDAYSLISVG